MRTPRRKHLPQTGGTVHKFWRAHNREYLLTNNEVKKSYLESLFFATEHKSVRGEVRIHAYCVMSNHAHESISYGKSTESLSNHMRIAHGRFGRLFNKEHKRQGAVAYDRPKTPLIQPNDWHQMRVHFYIEANPVRARMVRNLKTYLYSSYRFYAWGIRDEFSCKLSIPDWYLKLGKTAQERQAKYRSLFEKYLGEISFYIPEMTRARFIGDPIWVLSSAKVFKTTASSLSPD